MVTLITKVRSHPLAFQRAAREQTLAEFTRENLFTAPKGQRPSRSNVTPFSDFGGKRGSLVLYSPASFYNVLGQEYEYSTLAAAQAAGAGPFNLTPAEVAQLFPLIPASESSV
jgi:hypothetical protein